MLHKMANVSENTLFDAHGTLTQKVQLVTLPKTTFKNKSIAGVRSMLRPLEPEKISAIFQDMALISILPRFGADDVTSDPQSPMTLLN